MASTNISHPNLTFRVSLTLNRTEAIGPNTNQADVRMLHPDRYTSFIDDQQSVMEPDRPNHRSALLGVNKLTSSASPAYLSLPGVANGMNLKDGDEFTLQGQEAHNVRMKYVAGDWNNNVPTAGLGSILEIV